MTSRLRIVADGDANAPDMPTADGILADAARVAAERPLCGMIVSEHAVGNGDVEIRIACRPQSRAVLYGLFEGLRDALFPDAPDEG